jgi:hypothetical protein
MSRSASKRHSDGDSASTSPGDGPSNSMAAQVFGLAPLWLHASLWHMKKHPENPAESSYIEFSGPRTAVEMLVGELTPEPGRALSWMQHAARGAPARAVLKRRGMPLGPDAGPAARPAHTVTRSRQPCAPHAASCRRPAARAPAQDLYKERKLKGSNILVRTGAAARAAACHEGPLSCRGLALDAEPGSRIARKRYAAARRWASRTAWASPARMCPPASTARWPFCSSWPSRAPPTRPSPPRTWSAAARSVRGAARSGRWPATCRARRRPRTRTSPCACS